MATIDHTEVKTRLGNPLFLKYDAFIVANDITEQEFVELMLQILKTEAATNLNAHLPAAPKVISIIKIWASPLFRGIFFLPIY